MNNSDKIKFDHWIKECPIENIRVEDPVSMVRSEYGKWDYLIKVYLTIDKDDWDNNQNPGNPQNSENLPFQDRLRQL